MRSPRLPLLLAFLIKAAIPVGSAASAPCALRGRPVELGDWAASPGGHHPRVTVLARARLSALPCIVATPVDAGGRKPGAARARERDTGGGRGATATTTRTTRRPPPREAVSRIQGVRRTGAPVTRTRKDDITSIGSRTSSEGEWRGGRRDMGGGASTIVPLFVVPSSSTPPSVIITVPLALLADHGTCRCIPTSSSDVEQLDASGMHGQDKWENSAAAICDVVPLTSVFVQAPSMLTTTTSRPTCVCGGVRRTRRRPQG